MSEKAFFMQDGGRSRLIAQSFRHAVMMAGAIACAAWPSPKPENFSYTRSLSAPDGFSAEVGSVVLDKSVFSRASIGMGDIRLFAKASTEIPYAIRTVTKSETLEARGSFRLKQTRFEKLPGNRMSLQFSRDRSKNPIPSSIFIQTPNANFEKNIMAYSSTDGKTWKELGESQIIFDYSKYVDMRSTEITIQPVDCEYYKVIIDNATEANRSPFTLIAQHLKKENIVDTYKEFCEYAADFRIDGVIFGSLEKTIRSGRPTTVPVPLAIDSSYQDTAERSTILIIETGRQPLAEMSFHMRTDNFIRSVAIEGSNDSLEKAEWQPAGQGIISRIHLGSMSKDSLTIRINPVARYSWCRVIIRNRDNQPLQIDSVTGASCVTEMVFLPGNEKSLILGFGNDSIAAPSYDMAAILDTITASPLMRWAMGAESFHKITARSSWLDLPARKYLLWAALLIMVGVLTYVLVVTVRRVDKQTG